jgi:hypothetical protein
MFAAHVSCLATPEIVLNLSRDARIGWARAEDWVTRLVLSRLSRVDFSWVRMEIGLLVGAVLMGA